MNNDERRLAPTAVNPKKIIKYKHVKKLDNKKFDFEVVLNTCAREELDNTAKVDHLKNKIKFKKNKGKQFNSVNLLHEFYLSVQEVIDDQSEALKATSEISFGNFLDKHKYALFGNGLCNEKKLDGSMNTHFIHHLLYILHCETKK